MTPGELEARRRLYEDFDTYSKHALKIRTKAGRIEPLILNEAQRRLGELIEEQRRTTGRVRIVILKGRQMGLSTMVGGWLYWWVSQHPACRSLVVTHHSDSTRALFDMTKRYHDNCPPLLKPSTKYSSRRELNFDKLDSSYIVATAGGDGIARGETLTHAHLSEIAFWPKGDAHSNFLGLMQAIPDGPGTAVFVESTANGMSGVFYDLWQGAVKGENGFLPIFLPWFIQPEYRAPVTEDFEPTWEEEKLIERFGLDHEQLMFRRLKISQSGLDGFKQEYPCTAEEAFIASGSQVFDPEQVQEFMDGDTDPIERRMFFNGKFDEHSRGHLKVYYEHDPAETYYIGVDTAAGIRGRDYSVATVTDSRRNVVAVLRDHLHPDYFAEVVTALGYYYNEAKIIVESNNHGILTATRIGKDYAYPNFYTEQSFDKLTETYTEKLGFTTTVKSKPLIIDKLRADLRLGEVVIKDMDTLKEMQTYILDENGKMTAEEGCHDDTVMALALSNYINEGHFVPIEMQDDWYVESI